MDTGPHQVTSDERLLMSATPEGSQAQHGADARRRRAAYFQAYYLQHRERILAKNRLWAQQNAARVLAKRRAKRSDAAGGESEALVRACVDCGAKVVRAQRCRPCRSRFRYAMDPEYRARRLATSRRWRLRRLAEA